MKLLGLTGGIGMGKSTAVEMLRAEGCQVVDTDVIGRELVKPGEPALKEIERTFGASYVGPGGELRRRDLAELVFSNSKAKLGLESILHPRIRAAWLEKVANWRSAQVTVGVVVIPLLFETGAEAEFDGIISVACAKKTQTARLMERGWNVGEIERRNASQISSEEKMNRADWVVWTEGSMNGHQKQLKRILAVAA